MAFVIIQRRCKIIGMFLLPCEQSLSGDLTYTIIIVTANTWSEYYVTITNILLILTHSIFTISKHRYYFNYHFTHEGTDAERLRPSQDNIGSVLQSKCFEPWMSGSRIYTFGNCKIIGISLGQNVIIEPFNSCVIP